MGKFDEIKSGYEDQRQWAHHVLNTKDRDYRQVMGFRKKIPEDASASFRFGIKLYRWIHLSETTLAMCKLQRAALTVLQESGVQTYAEIPEDIRADILDSFERVGIKGKKNNTTYTE